MTIHESWTLSTSEALLQKLVDAYSSQPPGGSKAVRLWNAAMNVLPASAAMVLTSMSTQIGRGGIGWRHIDEAIRAFDRECDRYFDLTVAGNVGFPRARDLIRKRAASEEDRDLLFDHYAVAGDVLNEALLLLRRRQTSLRPSEAALPLLGKCKICWRTGTRARKGNYYCRFHQPRADNHTYKAAKLLYWWKPFRREQDPDRTTYQSRMHKKARIRVDNGLTIDDDCPEFLDALRSGRTCSIEALPPRRMDLADAAEQLPFVHAYLKSKKRKPVDFSNAASVTAALDPIGRRQSVLHGLLHQAYARDQRLIVEMMQEAESWLEAEEARRSRWGGDKRPGMRHPRASARRKLHRRRPVVTR